MPWPSDPAAQPPGPGERVIEPLTGVPGGRARVRISAPGGASDLDVFDRTYAKLASGVGSLDLLLPEGEYQVRQRVGDDEQIESFSVAPDSGGQSVVLPLLSFPSPIPLPGTTFGQEGTGLAQVMAAKGNVRLLLRAPLGATPGHAGEARRSRVARELARLGLAAVGAGDPEGTRQPLAWEAVTWTDQGDVLCTATLQPGLHVLMQAGEAGRRRCLPIWSRAGFVVSVFLLSLEVNGTVVPVALDHAGVSYWHEGDQGQALEDELTRLEATRKALATGRRGHGEARRSLDDPGRPLRNPLLHLMEATLLLHGSRDDLAQALACVALAGEDLGTDFPDVALIRCAAQAQDTAAQPPAPGAVPAAPPLLRRSWDWLLRLPQRAEVLARVMPHPYKVDGTGVWFIWSEDVVQPPPRQAPSPVRLEAPPASPFKTRHTGLSATLSMLRRGMATVFGRHADRLALPEAQGGLAVDLPASRTAETVVSVNQVVGVLVALLESGTLQRLMDQGMQRLDATAGGHIDDELVRRLLAALRVLEDEMLVKALGAEPLARQALSSLGLPSDRIVALFRSTMARMLPGVDVLDQAQIVRDLNGMITLGGTWVVQAAPAAVTEEAAPHQGRPQGQ